MEFKHMAKTSVFTRALKHGICFALVIRTPWWFYAILFLKIYVEEIEFCSEICKIELGEF